jgi:phosphocarrier protein FPr/phosphocarrier protein
MERVKLVAPLAGWLTSIREVPDPVFADELMGVGLAVDPTEGLVAAPCDATVILVSAQRHSVTLRTDEGAELLIHVGLETVALQGRGFEVHVRNGDRVSAGNPLISFDLDAVGLEAKSLITPILLTNAGDFQLSAEPLNRLVERGDLIGWIERAGVSKPVAVAGGDAVRREVVVRFQHGLHARPAARIADCAKRHSSEVTISLRGKTASARSPVALMALNAGPGDQIEVKASGPDGLSAIEEIVKLLETGEATAENVSVSTAGRPLAENAFAGVCGLAGVAIGTAVHWRRQVTVAADRGRGIAEERSALEEARASLRSRLQALGCGGSGAASTIALAHIGLLDDEELNAAAAHEIDRGRSAARAWQIATEHASRALQESGNRLLQERVADLNDIAAQLTAALVGEP